MREWKVGDAVVHSGRPEWGVGTVKDARVVAVNGSRSQNLTIRFDRAGMKTLSTSFADLRPAVAPTDAPAAVALVEDEADHEERLAMLPETATDPFRPPSARLAATIALYRYTSGGASLLDWAIAQTGLRDPLSKFSRHELEHAFERFRVVLDQNLRNLAVAMKRQDPTGLSSALSGAPAGVHQALRRMDALR